MEPIIIQNMQRTGSGWTCVVEVGVDSDTASHHNVTLDDDTYDRLTASAISPEDLIELSFKFLLEREPKESILPNFDLDMISKYFDDYESVISKEVESS